MDAGRAVLLLLALLTAQNWTVHYYTHSVTYRLFPFVAEQSGDAGFVRYHRAYEQRLPLSIYLPWTALTLVSAVFVAIRPSGLSVGWPVTLLLLNASIAGLSLIFAAPVHRRIDAVGTLTTDDARALLRYNGIRLIVASASLLVAAVLALHYLAGTA